MNANDRIALIIGRLVIQAEHNANALAEKDKIIESLKVKAKPGKPAGPGPHG